MAKKKPQPQLSEANLAALRGDIKKRGVEKGTAAGVFGKEATKKLQPAIKESKRKEEKTTKEPTKTNKIVDFGKKLVTGEYTDLGKKYEEETGKKVTALVYTGPSFGGTSLLGNRIPDAEVVAAGKAAGLTNKGIQQLKFALGQTRVQETLRTLLNPKSTSLMTNIAKKVFDGKTLAILGTAVSTIFLGKWGQAEAGEPLSIAMRDVMKQAEISGDWSLYDEAKAAREDLTDLSKWEQILSNTPFISPFIGIPNKIKGVKEAGKIMDELASIKQEAKESGTTEDDIWAQREADRIATREAERIEDEAYYAQIQKDIATAKAEARKDDERYWAKVLADREAYETAKREAENKYWENVKKLNEEIRQEEQKRYEDYGSSQLSFGLL